MPVLVAFIIFCVQQNDKIPNLNYSRGRAMGLSPKSCKYLVMPLDTVKLIQTAIMQSFMFCSYLQASAATILRRCALPAG